MSLDLDEETLDVLAGPDPWTELALFRARVEVYVPRRPALKGRAPMGEPKAKGAPKMRVVGPKKSRAAYMKAWRAKNPEKWAANQRRYKSSEKGKAAVSRVNAGHYARNRERLINANRARRAA